MSRDRKARTLKLEKKIHQKEMMGREEAVERRNPCNKVTIDRRNIQPEFQFPQQL